MSELNAMSSYVEERNAAAIEAIEISVWTETNMLHVSDNTEAFLWLVAIQTWTVISRPNESPRCVKINSFQCLAPSTLPHLPLCRVWFPYLRPVMEDWNDNLSSVLSVWLSLRDNPVFIILFIRVQNQIVKLHRVFFFHREKYPEALPWSSLEKKKKNACYYCENVT